MKKICFLAAVLGASVLLTSCAGVSAPDFRETILPAPGSETSAEAELRPGAEDELPPLREQSGRPLPRATAK